MACVISARDAARLAAPSSASNERGSGLLYPQSYPHLPSREEEVMPRLRQSPESWQ